MIKHMSVVSRVLAHRPDAFYVLSGASPYIDVSRRRLSNISPSVTRVPVSPARGILETVNLAAATTITLHKAPAAEFTLMTQTKPLTANSTNLLSFFGAGTEGLWQTGKIVSFGVRHIGGALTTVSAEIDPSVIHILSGAAGLDKITLYVDGNPVATKEVTNTALFDLDNTLTLGSANAGVYSFAAAWMRTLPGPAISEISQAARPVPLRASVASSYSTSDLRIDNSSADLESFTFSEQEQYIQNAATVIGNKILASYDSTPLTVAGNVRFPLPFVSTTGGIRVAWKDSNGATVKYSTDGTNYTTLYNGQTFGSGSTIADQPIIEVSFAAGQTVEAYLDTLTAERQVTSVLTPVLSNGRDVALVGSVSLTSNSDPRRYASSPATFGADGRITIAPETEDVSVPTWGVELWYTPVTSDLTGTKYILDSNPDHASSISIVAGKLNFSGFATVYVNKPATTTNTLNLVAGVPYQIVAIYSASNNNKITLGHATAPVQGNLSAVGLIRQTVTQTDINNLFDLQQDIVATRTTGDSISAADTAVQNYNLVWTSGTQ